MATSVERKALNEGTFRKANERLEDGARDLLAGDDTSPVPFICECPTAECMEVVLVTLAEYERARSRSEFGLAAVGHEDLEIERVVEQNDRFTITEKVGAAGEVHRQTDQRRMTDNAAMDERAKRIGQNEALYRQVNERIKDMNEGFAMVSERFSVVCECGNVECTEQITLSPERYEQTRQDPTHFLVKPGHEALETERVVDRAEDGSYAIVEKAPTEARRRAEEADPRS